MTKSRFSSGAHPALLETLRLFRLEKRKPTEADRPPPSTLPGRVAPRLAGQLVLGAADPEEAAGELLAAASATTRIRLRPAILSELRMRLLTTSLSSGLELVEQTYSNGEVVVRLARPDRREAGETILGAYNEGQAAA